MNEPPPTDPGAPPALPAEDLGPIGRGKYGFIVNPDASHLASSADVFRRLSKVLADAAPVGLPRKEIVFTHFVHHGLLALSLYAFPFHELTEDGSLIDVGAVDVPLRFLISANMPVALQLQSAIALLSEYVARQELVDKALSDEASRDERITQIDRTVREVDRFALETVVDDLRLGWEASARFVARRAADIGIAFAVYYRIPALSGDEVQRRAALTQTIYNEMELVREAIDRTVGLIAGREFEVKGLGAPERVRTFIRQATSAADLWRYLAHAMRDSLVCGNGYLVLPKAEPLAFHCLDPRTTAVERDGWFVSGEAKFPPDGILHLRGLEQPGSTIGISVLEPLMVELGKMRIFEEIEKSLGHREHTLNRQQRLWLEDRRQQHERFAADRDAIIRRLFAAPPEQQLLRLGSELYLAGFERY